MKTRLENTRQMSAAASSSLDQRIATLTKTHDNLMEMVDKWMKTARDTLETTQRQVDEAKKLKQEIQETYDKLKELRGARDRT